MRALGIVALALGSASGASAQTQISADPDALEPARGRFLIATRQLRGPIFEESVVFLLVYRDTEALGLIVNQPTDIPLAELFDDVSPEAGTLHLGGPVEPLEILVLLRSDVPPERAEQVTGNVFVTVDERELLTAVSQSDAATRVRVFAGYAGWGPRQLDREIARGDWIVARPPPDLIFEAAPDGLWERMFLEHHRLVAAAPPASCPSGAPRVEPGNEATTAVAALAARWRRLGLLWDRAVRGRWL